MKKLKITFFILLSCLTFISLTCCNIDKDQNVYIENDALRLGFDKKTGALRVFNDLANSQEFLDGNIIPVHLGG